MLHFHLNKQKHKRLCETVDFIKIGIYVVLNLDNIFPASVNFCKNVSIQNVKNEHYKNLLRENIVLSSKRRNKLQKMQKVFMSTKC